MTEPISPLEILMSVMRDRYAQQDFDAAVAIAKAVAPFVHAKPRSHEAAGSLDTMRDPQLAELCRAGQRRTDTAQDNQE